MVKIIDFFPPCGGLESSEACKLLSILAVWDLESVQGPYSHRIPIILRKPLKILSKVLESSGLCVVVLCDSRMISALVSL